jgi:YD repeat-containing protein
MAPAESGEIAEPTIPAAPPPAGRAWVGKGRSTGLTLPHGSELRMDYNGQRFTGRVDNGALVFEGRSFTSPSGAADELCRTKDGRKTSLNGKELISVRFPGETGWVLLKTLEQQMTKGAVA